MNKSLAASSPKYDYEAKTSLLIHFAAKPAPKPYGCLLLPGRELTDKNKLIARVLVTAKPYNPAEKEAPDGVKMRKTLFGEICKVGGDGYLSIVEGKTRDGQVYL